MKSKDAIIINKILKYINELYDFIDGFMSIFLIKPF